MTDPVADPGADPAGSWSARHHGMGAASVPLLPGWIRLTDALAAPLVRLRVPATAVTVTGALLAVLAAAVTRPAPWAAVALVLLSVACDAVDGTVASRTGRVSRAGARADAVADRVADVAFAAVVWRCGAPLWLAAAAGLVSLAHEAYRAWRGGRLQVRITVDERPTRTVCTVLAAGSAAVSAATWPATVCAAVWLGLAAVGVAQLVRTAP